MINIDWISAEEPQNKEKLLQLSGRLATYYANRVAYYDYISGQDSWLYSDYLPNKKIIEIAESSSSILELGCGRASILNVAPHLANKYTGVEFSSGIIEENRRKFPQASFSIINDPYHYDLKDSSFDLVFSYFVIEHTIFPNLFIEECLRLLRPGGTLIIFAPNFLDNNWVVSQRVASNLKGGMQNLREGNIGSVFTSWLYSRVVVPLCCSFVKKKKSRFWINIDPACFYFEQILPDLDACYITSFAEIERYLRDRKLQIQQNEAKLDDFVRKRRLGFLVAKKYNVRST